MHAGPATIPDTGPEATMEASYATGSNSEEADGALLHLSRSKVKVTAAAVDSSLALAASLVVPPTEVQELSSNDPMEICGQAIQNPTESDASSAYVSGKSKRACVLAETCCIA